MKEFSSRIGGSIAALLAIALFQACTDSSGPPPQPVVTPVDKATAAAVSVSVTYGGDAPKPVEINMRASGKCADLHKEPVFDQPVQVESGQLADTLVYVKSGLGDRKFQFPTEPVVIDQRGCLYKPRVAALMAGQPLEFVNSDPEPHNVRGRPNVVRSWNFLMSRPESRRTLYFDKPEVGIRVGCDVHPWMSAYVSVLNHPYFAITGADGKVTLADLPPGDYTIAAWHETLGEREQKVTLAASDRSEVTLAY